MTTQTTRTIDSVVPPGVLAGWRLRLQCSSPPELYSAWLLESLGADVTTADGVTLDREAVVRALATTESVSTLGRLELTTANGGTYEVDFVNREMPFVKDVSDEAAWAWGGLAELTGDEDGPALAPDAPLSGQLAGVHAVLAILAARTGDIQSMQITIDAADVVASLIEVFGLAIVIRGEVRSRSGDWGGMVGWGLYDCADGRVAVAFRDSDQIRRAGRELGIPEIEDGPFEDFLWGGLTNADLLQALFLATFAARSVSEVVAALRRARVAVSPVQQMQDLLESEHLLARNTFEVLGDLRVPRFPARLPRGEVVRPFQGAAGAAGPRTLPLAGVRVVDISSVWAGPMAVRLLLDLGATVKKVERQEAKVGSFSTGEEWDRGYYSILCDRGKDPYVADLSEEEARDALLSLLADADILIENFALGSLGRLGLGEDELLSVNPKLTIVSMPAMGTFGPDAEAVGYGATIEQSAGIGALYSDEQGRPHRSGTNFSDPVAGLYAAIGGLLGVLAGGGQTVEVSQQEAALSMVLRPLIRHQMGKHPPRAQEATQRDGVWTFPLDDGATAVPCRTIDQVVGTPDAPGSACMRWVRHPNGVDFPLIALPWSGAFAEASPLAPAQMPRDVRDAAWH
ncbi:MAG: CoA transferase [Dehalococcoidia bacterium]|nr:CoA transferase [Dehalococcoidia bacterium]